MSGFESPPLADPKPQNPYVGPRPLESGERIFGRERELTELYYLLSAERVVLLHSPSGAGKSSLVQAGLIPRLRERFDVWRPTRVGHLLPEGVPEGTNRYVLSAVLGFEQGIPERVRRPPTELARLRLAEYAASRPRRSSAPEQILVIFDQFEEILTADSLAIGAKQAFFEQLGELLQNPLVWALFMLREDYLAPLGPYVEQVPTHLQNRYRINLLDLDSAREAIARPAQEGRRKWTKLAVEQLVNDLAKVKVQQPDNSFVQRTGLYVEPMQLQVVCRSLWERMPADDVSVDPEDLEQFGNVTQALSSYYAGELATITAGDERKERALREWIGEKMITADGIRSRVMLIAGEGDGLANDLILRLLDCHLVRAENRGGSLWYELAHDRLIEPVRRSNEAWFAEKLSLLQQQAKLWSVQGKLDGLLLRGKALRESEVWAAAQPESAPLKDAEAEFLDKSRQARTERQRQARANQRLRILLAIAVFAGLLATALGVQTYLSNLTTRSVVLAGQSADALSSKDKWLATIAAVQALNISYTLEAERALAAATFGTLNPITSIRFALPRSPSGPTVGPGTAHRSDGPADGPLPKSAGGITAAAFARGGGRALIVLDASEVQIWDVHAGKALTTLHGRSDKVVTAVFSLDGERVLTIADHGPVRSWDASLGKELLTLKDSAGTLAVAMSPDDQRIVTAGEDGKVQIWDSSSGKRLRTLEVPYGSHVVALSPDGQRAITAHPSGVAYIWDVFSGKHLFPLLDKSYDVLRMGTFSPDSRRIVLVHTGGHVGVFEAASGESRLTFPEYLDEVGTASFSPNGQRIIASSDHKVYIWDVEHARELTSLPAASGEPVATVAISTDRIMVGYVSGRVDFWPIWKNLAELRESAQGLCQKCEPRTDNERRALNLYTVSMRIEQYGWVVSLFWLATVYLMLGWVIRRAVLAPQSRRSSTERPGFPWGCFVAAGVLGNGIAFLEYAGLVLTLAPAAQLPGWELALLLSALLPSFAATGVVYAHLTRWHEGNGARRGRILLAATAGMFPPGSLLVIPLMTTVVSKVAADRVPILLGGPLWALLAANVLFGLSGLGAALYIDLIQPWAAHYRTLHEDDD